MESLSWDAAWDSLVDIFCVQTDVPLQTHMCARCKYVYVKSISVSFLYLFRTLPGPEEVEAGSVSPPLGRHLLCAPRTHVNVIRRTKPASANLRPPVSPHLSCHSPAYTVSVTAELWLIRGKMLLLICRNGKYS